MKNLRSLLILTLCMFCFATISSAQLKIVTTGDAYAYKKLFVGADAGTTPALIYVGRNRTGAGTAGFIFYNSQATAASMALVVASNGSAQFLNYGANAMDFRTQTAQPLRFYTDKKLRMTVDAGGTVKIAGSATVNGGMAVTSDRRLKQNIAPYSKGLAEVLKINPVSFEYNGEGNTTKGEKFIGVVAQDLQKVAPEFVSDFEHEIIETVSSSREKSDSDSPEPIEERVIGKETYLKVHDSEIKYLLVNAIKEQQKLIDQKNEKITTIEAQVAKLTSMVDQLSKSMKTTKSGK